MRYEGNIFRPPGEWRSYLLQVTVGCSHNGCTFCSMYKDKRFRICPLEELFEDIDMARACLGDVRRVFLCDGDAIIMETDDLLRLLARLYGTFPNLERVSAYAGPVSTLKKSGEELAALRKAGLYRLYLGVETGNDDLLRAIRKGVDAAVIDAVCAMEPDRVVMISCNSATAARDAAILCEKGYRVDRLQAVDMFPRTQHVECVVLLSREKADDYIRISVHTEDLQTKTN